MLYIWLNIFITLPLLFFGTLVWCLRSLRPATPGPLQMKRPTNLEALIASYMKRDALDPTSTITFLIEADALKDPFAEHKPQPPPRPSDAATSARPPRSIRRKWAVVDQNGREYGVFDSESIATTCAYQLSDHGKPMFLVDDYGRRKHVAERPHLIAEEGTPYNSWYDKLVQEEIKQAYERIHPMDEPYPVEIIRPPLPGKQIYG